MKDMKTVFRNPNGKHKSGRSTLKENDFLRAKLQSQKKPLFYLYMKLWKIRMKLRLMS